MSSKDEFVQAFSRAQLNFSQLYGLLLIDAELSLQQYALLNLLQALGPVSMTDASKKLHLSKPAITNITDQFESKKILKRIQNSEDRRSYYLQIQPKGEALLKKIQNTVFELLLKNLEPFNKEGKEAVRNFYVTLSDLIEENLKFKHKRKA